MLAQFLQKFPSEISQGHVNGLPPCKIVAPQLDKARFPKVKFWTRKLFKEACQKTIGDTNALATSSKKRGRPQQRNSGDTDDKTGNGQRHNYLEDANSNLVEEEHIKHFSLKARKIWNALQTAKRAPFKWSQIDNDAYEYFKSKMLNEFTKFQLCEGSWKLDHWATLNYPLWVKNHLVVKTELSNKTSKKKAKLEGSEPATPNIEGLDNVDLITMDSNNDPLDNSTFLLEPDVAIVGQPKPKPILVCLPSAQLFFILMMSPDLRQSPVR
jgi:hypothetical protein